MLARFLIPAWCLLCLGCANARGGAAAGTRAPALSAPTYTNPIGAVEVADPFVLLYSNRYYLYGTGFKTCTSVDLVNWQSLEKAYRPGERAWGTGAFWAPEVIFHSNRFYAVVTCTHAGQEGFRLCLLVSDRPEGPFTELYGPWCDVGWSSIDGHIFIDDDGTPYLFFDHVGVLPQNDGKGPMFGLIYAMRLKRDLSGPAGEPVLCAKADQEWEEPHSTFSRCNEGAFVIKHAGRYYLTYSAHHYAKPRYGIGYATAPAPLGPWTKSASNPLARTDPALGVSGPGHNSIVASPDGKELFMVYHTHRDPAKPSAARVLNIDRIVFDADGRMRLQGPTRTPQPLPSGAPGVSETQRAPTP